MDAFWMRRAAAQRPDIQEIAHEVNHVKKRRRIVRHIRP